MFFSLKVSYVLKELRIREDLRRFMNIHEIPKARTIRSYLSKLDEERFVDMVLRILNMQCGKRRRVPSLLLCDSTEVTLDINWFRRRIRKADLEDREFKWGYSPSKGHYIGYKLTMVVDRRDLRPLVFLLHQGSPNDAKLYDEVLGELKRRRLTRIGDVIVFDKGYFSYKNYLKGISRYKIVPLIFPRKYFDLNRLLGLLSYPLRVFTSGSEEKETYRKLAKALVERIKKWQDFKPLRSLMEDIFKVCKKAFGLERLHRYTKRSIKKFVALNVLLLGMIVSNGIRQKEKLQRLAES
jgi:hypothetical protein